MLSWRLHTGPEKAELQELNVRLYDYVCRVRELERENLLLEEELRSRRGQEGLEAEGQARWAEEARCLRQQLDELSWATALAEGERDALRRELRELGLLAEEARAARRRLDAELSAERRELQEAVGARAALEALLGRLQAERRGLHAARERDVRELRARSAGLTLRYSARAARPAAPPQRLQEVQDSYRLLVAESWRETVQLYEDKVRELEEALRRGQESRRQAEEEKRLCAQEAEALQRQALELEQLRALLEEELLRMREALELQAEERQSVIAHLEDEKAALSLAMADRLRDYQDLVQVKTGLSLEVATYRALLEGESNPDVLILTERIESLPQELRSTSHQHTSSVLQKENERNLFLRHKAPSRSFHHSWAQPVSQPAVGNASRRHFLGPGYPSLTTSWQENAYEKPASRQASFRAFSPMSRPLRNTEVQVQTFPTRPRTEGTGGLARESTLAQESHRGTRDKAVAGASESTWSHERTVVLGKKTEAQVTREQERNRPGTVQTKREEKLFDSKEKASEERNLRWEELTKLDKEARMRETQQMRDKAKGQESWKEKHAREREIPISLEVSRGSTAEGTPKGAPTPVQKDAGGGPGGGVGTREPRFRLDTSDATGSLKGDSVTETIAESIVSTVLQQFTQSPDTETSADSFPDTKVTYVGRTELPGEKKTKTEIVVESKLTEEIDVTDEAGLDYLLSTDARDKVGLKGKPTEWMIGDIINLGLKGREGRAKVVNVEITEEPMSYVGGGEAPEFPTPFHVEEADDMSPGSKGLVEEEGYGETEVTFSTTQRKKTKLPQESVTHVEEVTEAGDSEGEQSYFVSTPDEAPEHGAGRDRDEGSVYGQIHIEEESTIRYSWQDEIVPVSQRRLTRDELGEKVVEPPAFPEPSREGHVGSPHWIEQTSSGEFHAETTVVEKEIKIPHEFHTSMKRGFREPRHQLVEVIGQLEENLPERVKEELSALTSEGQGGLGSLSVDVKKVQTSGGEAVTLMAEVNLSQTVDADQLDLEELSKDEADAIEKAVESVVRDTLARRRSPAPGSPDRDPAVAAPAFGFKRWATQELYRPSEEDTGPASRGTERVPSHGPVSATVEVSSPRGFTQSHVLENVAQSVRHVTVGPAGIWRTEQVSPEAPPAGEGSGDGGLRQAASPAEGASWSRRHFPLDPGQSQVSQEIFFSRGPVPASREAQGTGEPRPAELSADTERSGSRSALGSQQFHAQRERTFQGLFSGAGEAGDYFRTEESADTLTSVRHLQLGPREGFSEQIQVTAPLSDTTESDIGGASVHTREWSGASTSVRHVPVSSQRLQTTEQRGLRPGGVSDSESSPPGQGSAGETWAAAGYSVGRTVLMTQKSPFQGSESQSPQEASGGDTSGAEETLATSTSFRHIRLGPTETVTSERVVFHGPISPTSAPAGSTDAPERRGEATDRTLRHIALGPKEASFTFQMDVGHVAATPSWTPGATALLPAGTEAEDPGGTRRDAGPGGDRAAGVSAQGQEQAEFDKMVQLQRMVDQRSVISDEKKVAVLYLDHQGEDDEGHWF